MTLQETLQEEQRQIYARLNELPEGDAALRSRYVTLINLSVALASGEAEDAVRARYNALGEYNV